MKANSESIPADDVPAPEEPGAAPPAETGGLPVPPREEETFPVVGIGASAGGLEALEEFLRGVPPGSGMAFVVVQHLDPTHAGMLPELLQRATPMPVIRVTETVAVRPDTVYVIPPGRDLALLRRTLHLLEPHAPRGLRLPIDFLFRSLADDLGEQAIGVVLSGMGSDGTLGLRAIKGKGGLALVQDPASVRFDGMPRSAIATGLADIVAPAGELAGRILAFVRHLPIVTAPEPAVVPGAASEYDQVVILLRSRTGHDFSLYKKSTINRRIERRMAIHQIDRTADYVRLLQENPAEQDLLFKEFLIGVTSFFRDPAVWDELAERVIPDLIAAAPDGATLRAWVAGCSTGEEAFSLAIVFREALATASPPKRCTLQCYATDLDGDAVDRARTGRYPETIAADVSEERLSRFFVREEKEYVVSKEVREMVVFAPQNLLADPPFTKLDLLSCRNLLIYLEPEVQRRLIPLFHYALNPGGVLVLGTAESIGSFGALFNPVDAQLRIYRRTGAPATAPLALPTAFAAGGEGKGYLPPAPKQAAANLQTLADMVVLREYAPAAVLTTADGDILYINGKTGRFLEPASGKANWNIFAMARDGLRAELNGAFRRAVGQEEPVAVRGVRIGVNGGTVHVDVTVRRLAEPAPLKGLVLIVIDEVPAPPGPPPRRKGKHTAERELEEQLRQAEETLQSTREEMQSSQEELKSANEELQSSNEEIQSTNEELTTSREEMQSLNEELQTVNTELESRVADLSRVNDDMRNLLNSSSVATVFLDGRLNLRWYTAAMVPLINLLPGDVGRPVTDIASDLLYPELSADAREVLRTLIPFEREVATRDRRRFQARVTPYRTVENRIDGVVIVFTEVTAFRALEQDLEDARAYAEAIVETVREPLLVLDGAMRVVSANRSFYRAFGVGPGEVEERELSSLGNGQWEIPELRRLLETVLPENASFDDFRVEHDFPRVGRRVLLLNARRISGGKRELILLAFEDVTGTARENTP